jgi:hypothetical protein
MNWFTKLKIAMIANGDEGVIATRTATFHFPTKKEKSASLGSTAGRTGSGARKDP